jgi:hypothetical protein
MRRPHLFVTPPRRDSTRAARPHRPPQRPARYYHQCPVQVKTQGHSSRTRGSVPAGAGAVLLALGRRDGLCLDRWLAGALPYVYDSEAQRVPVGGLWPVRQGCGQARGGARTQSAACTRRIGVSHGLPGSSSTSRLQGTNASVAEGTIAGGSGGCGSPGRSRVWSCLSSVAAQPSPAQPSPRPCAASAQRAGDRPDLAPSGREPGRPWAQ